MYSKFIFILRINYLKLPTITFIYLFNFSKSTETEKRIVENLYSSLVKLLQEKILAFQEIQNSIMSAKKENILRAAKINLNRDLTDEESQQIIENPALMQEMMKSKLLSGAHQGLKNALYDIEERHKDLLNLERNVNEIHRMFVDLALLVSLQGDIIDNIEVNVRNAKESVLHAEDDLILSKNNLAGARKVICLLCFFVFFCLIFFVILCV